MNKVFLSIVIANYNYGRFLEEAISSVLHQSYKDFELIIVDGGSTDNSVEIIKKYKSRIAWWCSEKDRGQSNAFNKGFAQAKGRMLTWLNADDIMFPGALEQVKAKYDSIISPAKAWIVGGCFWLTPDMKVIRCSRARHFSAVMARWNVIPVWGPSSFFSKKLLDDAGGVDEQFHYTMDRELWLRFWKQQRVSYIPVSSYCWGLRLHPEAKMSGHHFVGSSRSNPTHPAWRHLVRENEMVNQKYGKLEMPLVLRYALAALSPASIQSRLDTWRLKGTRWQEAIIRLGQT